MSRIFLFVFSMVLGLAWQHTKAYAASADAVIVPQDQIEVVSASSDMEGAASVLDGDKGTAWTVNGPFPQELVLKLPESYMVTALQYVHANKTDYLNQYSIYISEDGQNWENTSAPGTLKNSSMVWEVRMSWPREAQ